MSAKIPKPIAHILEIGAY